MTSGRVDSTDLCRRFLIACLNSRREPSALQSAESLIAQNDIDWHAVGAMAAAERIAPLLFHTTRGSDLLPQWLVDRCHTAYLETGIQNALRLREMSLLLREFSDTDVPAIVLKGAALVEQVYGNVALRPMVDIDLLVQKNDVPKALAIADHCGYRHEGREVTPGATLAYENEILLRKEGRQRWQLELHWSLFDSPFYQQRLPIDALWESAGRMVIEGAPAFGLSVEWMLLHLCGHLALHHRETGLLWWNDVAELISSNRSNIDWNEVFERAQASDLVLPLQSILPAVAGNWRATVPQDVLDRLATLVPSRDEALMYKLLTVDNAPPGQRLLADARGIETWPARVRFIFRNLIPTGSYMDDRYGIKHPSLRIFFYVYRWFLGISGVLGQKVSKDTKFDVK